MHCSPLVGIGKSATNKKWTLILLLLMRLRDDTCSAHAKQHPLYTPILDSMNNSLALGSGVFVALALILLLIFIILLLIIIVIFLLLRLIVIVLILILV